MIDVIGYTVITLMGLLAVVFNKFIAEVSPAWTPKGALTKNEARTFTRFLLLVGGSTFLIIGAISALRALGDFTSQSREALAGPGSAPHTAMVLVWTLLALYGTAGVLGNRVVANWLTSRNPQVTHPPASVTALRIGYTMSSAFLAALGYYQLWLAFHA